MRVAENSKMSEKSKRTVLYSMRMWHNHDAKYAHCDVEQWWREDMVELDDVSRYKKKLSMPRLG